MQVSGGAISVAAQTHHSLNSGARNPAVRLRKLNALASATLLPAGALKACGSVGSMSANPRPAASTRRLYSGPAHDRTVAMHSSHTMRNLSESLSGADAGRR